MLWKTDRWRICIYGKAICDKEDFSYLHEEVMRSLMSVCVPEPGILSMQYTKQEYPVITRSVRILQKGDQKIRLENMMSASVEFPDMDFEMLQLSGAWSRERYVKTRKLEMGIQAIQSLSGTASSAEQNPFIALKVEGDFYRILSPFEGNETAWMVVSRDKKHAVAGYYERLNKVNAAWMCLCFKGLDEKQLYTVKWEENSIKAYGNELMYAGIPIDRDYCNKTNGDFYFILYIIEAE